MHAFPLMFSMRHQINANVLMLTHTFQVEGDVFLAIILETIQEMFLINNVNVILHTYTFLAVIPVPVDQIPSLLMVFASNALSQVQTVLEELILIIQVLVDAH